MSATIAHVVGHVGERRQVVAMRDVAAADDPDPEAILGHAPMVEGPGLRVGPSAPRPSMLHPMPHPCPADPVSRAHVSDPCV